MRALGFVVLLGCGTVHTSGVSVAHEKAERERVLREGCSILTGVRHATCMKIGFPRAPEREQWATASWWLYESRSWESGPAVEQIGAQVVCASYVAFDGDRVTVSDEQCHHVKHYDP